jgi:hypothetical protein
MSFEIRRFERKPLSGSSAQAPQPPTVEEVVTPAFEKAERDPSKPRAARRNPPLSSHGKGGVMGSSTLKVWRAIAQFITTHGFAPTIRELSAEVGIAYSGVNYQIALLAEYGVLKRTPGHRRTIVLLQQPPMRKENTP